jgi:PAS domain S-box-containing protein
MRILHVDNDVEDHILVQTLLSEAQGQRVTLDWTASLTEARQLLDQNGYQAVLVDYDLDEGSGIELIREYVARGYPAPMILLTGRGSHEVDMEAMQAGATLYLSKGEINALLLERSIRYAIDRKRSEMELRQSEERFALAFRSNPAALTITRTADGRYLDVNDAFCEMTGYERDELIGRTSVEMGFFKSAEQRTELLGIVREKGRLRNYEMELHIKSGDPCYVLFSLEPIRMDDEDCLLGTSVNITKRKLAEEEKQRAFSKYNSLADADVIGIITATADGRIRDANDYVLDMLGYTRQDLEAGRLDWRAITPPEYEERDARALAELELYGICQPYEKQYIRRDGKRVWVSLKDVLLDTGEIIALIENINRRKQIEDQLRIFADVVQHSSDFIGLATPDMKPFFVNESGRRMVGLDLDADVSQTAVLDYFWPDERARIEQEAIPALLQDGRWSGEVRFRSFATGEPVFTIWSAFAIRDEQGQPIAYATTSPNLTPQKQIEAALEFERARLAAAIETLPVGVALGDPQGETLTMNAAALRLHGFNSLEEMISRLDRYFEEFEMRSLDGSLIPTEAWPAPLAMRGEFVQDFEVRLRSKVTQTEQIVAYSTAPVYASDGELLQIVYVLQDRTARRQAEETLKASEQRFRELADSMPQLVWTARPDGTVEYYNSRFREYAGIEQGAEEAWQWAPVLHPDDRDDTMAAWQHAVRTGEVYQAEHRVRMADGSYRWHLSRGLPAYDEQGRLVRWYGTATDVHALHQVQAELSAYARRLEHSNEELENFALVASHDLQEPLRKIHMFGENLKRQLRDQLPEESADYLERMQNAANRMQDMIDGLLRLAQVGRAEIEFQPVDLNRLADEVIADLEGRIRSTGGAVTVGELPPVQGDPLQLRQLLQNLIGNGLKFHRAGTPPLVQVTGELDEDGERPTVCIQVSDNGIGFDEQFGARIFQPFVRLHARTRFDGAGIGLAICRRIVERHHGTIAARSEVGRGSVFSVRLPAGQIS